MHWSEKIDRNYLISLHLVYQVLTSKPDRVKMLTGAAISTRQPLKQLKYFLLARGNLCYYTSRPKLCMDVIMHTRLSIDQTLRQLGQIG